MHYIYFLQSKKDRGVYVGFTRNVQVRLAAHNAGKVRATRHRRPFQVVYTEKQPSAEAAVAREQYFKSYKGSFEKRDILKRCGVV